MLGMLCCFSSGYKIEDRRGPRYRLGHNYSLLQLCSSLRDELAYLHLSHLCLAPPEKYKSMASLAKKWLSALLKEWVSYGTSMSSTTLLPQTQLFSWVVLLENPCQKPWLNRNLPTAGSLRLPTHHGMWVQLALPWEDLDGLLVINHCCPWPCSARSVLPGDFSSWRGCARRRACFD